MIYSQKASCAEQLRFERCFIHQFPDGLTNEHIFVRHRIVRNFFFFEKKSIFPGKVSMWLLLGSEPFKTSYIQVDCVWLLGQKHERASCYFCFPEKWWGASAQAWAYHVITHTQRLETPLLQEIWLTRLEDRIIGHDPFALYG